MDEFRGNYVSSCENLNSGTPEIANSCSNSGRRGRFWLLARGAVAEVEEGAGEVTGKMELQDVCSGGEARDKGERDQGTRREGARERNSERGVKSRRTGSIREPVQATIDRLAEVTQNCVTAASVDNTWTNPRPPSIKQSNQRFPFLNQRNQRQQLLDLSNGHPM